MATKTTLQAKNDSGGSLYVQETETDSPILPVSSLERLHKFRPDLVDFVVDQTRIEAEERRRQNSKINNFIFAEHLISVFLAFFIVVAGIATGTYLVILGHEWGGVAIMGAPLVTIVGIFIHGRWRSEKEK